MANDDQSNQQLYFNGINGATGEYGLPPMTGEELSQFIQGEAEPENLSELRFRYQKKNQQHLGVKEGVDPKKLEESGWGIIFAHNADPAIKEALSPLLKLREQQAGEHYRLYEKGEGYRVGKDNKNGFLARHGAGPGPADPDKVPYYLLIVGSPGDIAYRFQSQLDVQYAVGRIHFETLQEYANYAQSVVAAETGQVKLPRRISFFGVANDPTTTSTSDLLVKPLFEKLKDKPDWEVDALMKAEATKAQLTRLLGGDQTPALLFTGSHGMEFPLGNPHQLPHQGALLCQDWPGPDVWKGAIPQDFYFAGDDLTDEANLLGLLSFYFACYGAGTPRLDEFSKQAFEKQRETIAPFPFLAGLPTRMLGHPKGGALAVIGHVERAWTCSFDWSGAGAQTTVFESTLERLLDGHPIGSATEYFNERYAELATILSDELEDIEYGKQADPYELAGMWTANNDARGYVVIGDPAVRLPVAEKDEAPLERPVIEVQPVAVPSAPIAAPPPPPAPDASPIPRGGQSLSIPAQPGDEVHFSAFHPRAIDGGQWHRLLVYAHLNTALEAIKIDAGQILGNEANAYRQAEAEASTAIAPGTEITLVPQGQGLAFNPPQAKLTWNDAWQRADFEMQATGQRVGHVIEGSIGCYVGPLLVADIRLPVVVPKPGEAITETDQAQDIQSARMYQSIFCSYSHADTAIVEAVETAYKALGMDYLRDVMNLKSGQSWSDQLLNMIEQADIFQLFWSGTASQSPYVEQEWQYALNLVEQKGSAFIRPVYWEKPLPPVPAGLSHIHFAPVDFKHVVAAQTASEPEEAPPARIHGAGDTPAVTPGQPATVLPTAEEDLKTITVSTYSTADPANPGPARLKARTRISLTGDVDSYLPETITPEDETYLETHRQMVKAALDARLAYLELIAKTGGE